MKGRSKRASGGVNQDAQDKSQKSMSYTYQNNVEVMNTAKTLLLKTLQLGS